MIVKDIMTKNVRIADPDQKIDEIAKLMRDEEFGVMPVGENDRLIGMITDRDICCRAVADDRDPKTTTVRDIMSEELLYCFEDKNVEDILENMAEQQIRRMPVLSKEKRLVGIISLGDISLAIQEKVGPTLERISKPTQQHVQH